MDYILYSYISPTVNAQSMNAVCGITNETYQRCSMSFVIKTFNAIFGIVVGDIQRSSVCGVVTARKLLLEQKKKKKFISRGEVINFRGEVINLRGEGIIARGEVIIARGERKSILWYQV